MRIAHCIKSVGTVQPKADQPLAGILPLKRWISGSVVTSGQSVTVCKGSLPRRTGTGNLSFLYGTQLSFSFLLDQQERIPIAIGTRQNEVSPRLITLRVASCRTGQRWPAVLSASPHATSYYCSLFAQSFFASVAKQSTCCLQSNEIASLFRLEIRTLPLPTICNNTCLFLNV
jgi:hypothetical protein